MHVFPFRALLYLFLGICPPCLPCFLPRRDYGSIDYD